MTTSASLTTVPNPDRVFYQWVRQSAARSIVEIDMSAGPLNRFSTRLMEEGWAGVLLERNPAMLAHLKDLWKWRPDIRCYSLLENSVSETFLQAEMPNGIGILILNSENERLGVLQTLEKAKIRPWMIALKDEGETAENHSAAYSLLTRGGYRFAGVEQLFSLWSRVDAVTPAKRFEQGNVPKAAQMLAGKAVFETPTTESHYSAVGYLDLLVSGWAIHDESHVLPPSVYLEITDLRTGTVQYTAATRYARLDLARQFVNPDLLMCGFEAAISMRAHYPNGVQLRVLQHDGETCYCSATALTIDRQLKDLERTARRGLAQKFLRGSGVEIGALQKKLELPSSCKVRYVDRMGMADLLHHYPELTGLPLQAPDLVDDGEQLASIVAGSLDFVIANHFFEHCENPIHTLENLLRVLKPFGILYLAVPDKRYTFDSERPSTSYDVLRSTYRAGIRLDRSALFQEWVNFVELRDADSVPQRAQDLMETGYSIHFNVWTADDLFSLLTHVREDFALPFRITSAVCSDNETILLLEKNG